MSLSHVRYDALRLKNGKILVCAAHLRPGWAPVPIMDGLVLLVSRGLFDAARNQGAERLSIWT